MKKIPRPYLYLLLALSVAVLVWFLERPTAEKTGDILNKPLFSNLQADQVVSIKIEHLFNGVRLEKQNGEWQIAEIKTEMKKNLEKSEEKKSVPKQTGEKWEKVDSGKLATALDILLDTQAVSLAGNNPERHGTFEVNPIGEQIRLFDKDGKMLEHFYLGKAGVAFMEGYIRKEGQNEVYLANKFLRPYFPATVEGWVLTNK